MTPKQIASVLSYDPVNGVLRWKCSQGSARVGKIAGGLDKSSGYLRVNVNGHSYPAHRLAFAIMTGSFPKNEIDHMNGIRDDNRWLNLRSVSTSENARNRSRRSDNSTGAPGVYRSPRTGRWYAQACHGGKNRHLGVFDSFEKAAQARKNFQIENGYHENHGREVAAKRSQRLAGRN